MRTSARMAIGILAYGSLLDEPGDELADRVVRCIGGFETPFAVEFARKSTTRDDAPTLVPVNDGGAQIRASVLVLREDVSERDARDLLFDRETRGRGGTHPNRGDVSWIKALAPFGGVELCLYTALPANVDPLTAGHLAELAITSASGPAGRTRHDGVSYLEQQKRRGTRTPLMPAYEAAVLARTGGTDLCDAWARARAARPDV